MGLAIPAGGCIIASTTLLFLEMGIKPENFGLVYPITVIIVAYFPNFKGDGGEKIFLAAKIFALAMFAGIIYLTQSVEGMLTAVFATYAVFGIVNSLITLMTRDKL